MPIFHHRHHHHPLQSLWDWDMMVDRSRPSRLFDQNFGLTLDDDQIFVPSSGTSPPPHSSYSLLPYLSSAAYRPRRLHSRQESGVSQVDCSKEKFEVKLDVQQFSPEEITVKTVNNIVVIEGKHDEKQDEHGYIQRHFVRKYVLPEDVKPENVQCNLSSDGVLSVTAPRKLPEEDKEQVKVIPIVQTGRPAVVARQTSQAPTASTTTTTGQASQQQQGSTANTTEGNTTLINIQREGDK